MYISTPAIVLNRIKHTDSTLITTLYTQQMGSVTFAIKIPKTARAQIKPALFQPLNQLHIEWEHKPNSALQRLGNIHVSTPYATLSTHPQKATIATFLSEALFHALHQERQGELFPFLETSLLWFDSVTENYSDFHIIFLIKLARFLGFEPITENPGHYEFFDLINADYTPLRPTHNYYLTTSDSKYIASLCTAQYHNIHRLNITAGQRNRALRIITTYLKLHIPGFPHLNSITLLNSIS